MSIQTNTRKYNKKSKKAVKTINDDYTDFKKAIKGEKDFEKSSLRTTRSMSKERIPDIVEKDLPLSSRRSKRSIIPVVVPQVDEVTLNLILKENEKARGKRSRKKILDELDNEVNQDKSEVIEKELEKSSAKLPSSHINFRSRLSNGSLGVTLRSKGNTNTESEDKPIKKSTKKNSKMSRDHHKRKAFDETSDEDEDYLKLSRKKALATETSKIKSYLSSKNVSRFSNISKHVLNILLTSANTLILVFLLFPIFGFLFLSTTDPKSLTSLKSLDMKMQKLWRSPRLRYPSSDSVLIAGIFLILQFALDKLTDKFKGFISSVMTGVVYASLVWYKPFINAIVLSNVANFLYLFFLYTLLVVVVEQVGRMRKSVTLKGNPTAPPPKDTLLCYSDDEGALEAVEKQEKQSSSVLHFLTLPRVSLTVNCGHSAWIIILVANLAPFSLKPSLPFDYTVSCYMQIAFIFMTQFMTGWKKCESLVTASPLKTSHAWVVWEAVVWAPFAFTAYLALPRNSQAFSHYSYCVSAFFVICFLLGIVLRSNKYKFKKDLSQVGINVLDVVTLSTCLLVPGLQPVSVAAVASYLAVLFLRIYFFQ